jgi:hypothetical protein
MIAPVGALEIFDPIQAPPSRAAQGSSARLTC